jgi:hypothetical protein
MTFGRTKKTKRCIADYPIRTSDLGIALETKYKCRALPLGQTGLLLKISQICMYIFYEFERY